MYLRHACILFYLRHGCILFAWPTNANTDSQCSTAQTTTRIVLKSIIGVLFRKHAKSQQLVATLQRMSGASVPRSLLSDYIAFPGRTDVTLLATKAHQTVPSNQHPRLFAVLTFLVLCGRGLHGRARVNSPATDIGFPIPFEGQ